MKQSGFKRKPGKQYSTLANRKTAMRRSDMKKRAKKSAPKAEREHMGTVAGLYCVVCRNLRYGDSPAEVHHVRFLAGGGQRSSNLDTIPLCPLHHRLGGYGVAFHAGPEVWQRKFGTEAALLEQVQSEMGLTEKAA